MNGPTRQATKSTLVLIAIGAASCGLESNSAEAEPVEEQQQALLAPLPPPERPVLGPGESNTTGRKTAAPNTPGCPSLLTTDLSDPLTQTKEDVVNALLTNEPSAPVITNISYTGANIAAGTFTGGAGPIGLESGVILSSGNIATVIGPNALSNASTNLGSAGDEDLDKLVKEAETFDATVLEFDFECPETQNLTFRYVFRSEEYNEYVNNIYNDVFGFFLNGTNVALVPGAATPVAINNVNCGNPYNPPSGTNCGSFINNALDDGGGTVCTEMDGLTKVFTAQASANPGVNHIRLAIADTGDQLLDSNVFLEGGSFRCNRAPVARCQDVTVSAGLQCTASASVDNGSSDPDGDKITCTQTPLEPYQVGSTPVTLTCQDPSGASSSCTGAVTVQDTTAPEIKCPAPPKSKECVNGNATITFGAPSASDNCSVTTIGCAPPSGSTFPEGLTPVTCTASDPGGNNGTCSFNVQVIDSQPPTVTATGLGALWPPNHDYVTHSIADCGVNIADQCQGVIDLTDAKPKIKCVTSDEVENASGDGDGNTTKDMVIVNDTTVQLRAERAGGDNGRVYAIHFSVTDAEGNVGTGVCKANVPKSQGPGGVAVDSGPRYTVGSCL